MSTDKKVPDIRFKGFSGEWVYFPLEEISDVLDGDRGHNYPNGEELKEQGHTLFLSASNVTKNGFKFDTRQYITQDKSESLGNGKLIINDIVLTSRGSIGHIAWYNENITREIPFARINSGMLILRVKNNIDPSVISQYLKSPKIKKKIEIISFGSAQSQLTKTSISKFSVTIPIEKPEQTQIGNYFQKLDNLINQHQQKYDKLSNIKKSMLEKMFPKQGETIPEIRFKGFSGKWEEKTLGKVFTYERPDNYIVESAEYSDEYSTPVLTANKGFLLGYTNEKSTYNDPSIIFDDFTLDCKFVDFPYMVKSSAIKILTVKNSTEDDLLFAFHLLNAARIEVMGHARHYISVVQNTKVTIPKKNEQTAISNYFQKLDNLINQHQQQITKLNNIKQACLSKMFV